MSKLMILGASILQLPAIQKAISMGHDVVVADRDSEAIGFKEPGVIKEVISTIDTPKLLDAAKRHGIEGIMTLATDMPMRSVAVIANELGLIGVSEQTALMATDKGIMRDALKRAGISIPIYYRCKNYEEYINAVNSLFSDGYLCVVKPSDNSGSRGITLLDNEELTSISDAYYRALDNSRSGEVLVEEYMLGQEVSVETISVNNECHVIQITDKITNGAPNFVEMGHSQPSQLSSDIKCQISNLAIQANHALGITIGPSHTEIMVTKDGPKIVEVGARLGGDNITTILTPLSTGVDMVGCCIEIALGKTPDLSKKIDMASAIKYFPFDHGIIKSIIGIEEAKAIPGVKQVYLVRKIGDRIDGIKCSSDRVGYAIAQADNPTLALSICDEALSHVCINK